MRFQANPDDIKSLCSEVNHTKFTARAIIIGKNEKSKRLDAKQSSVDFSLTRNEPKENLKKQ
jgi:hypothetical protein